MSAVASAPAAVGVSPRRRRDGARAPSSRRPSVRTFAAAATELDCPHFDASRCDGCAIATGLDAPPLLARAREYFASKGVDFAMTLGPTNGWRCRAKLAARAVEDGALALGLFRRGTHDVAPIPGCVVQHPRINDAALAVEAACARLGVRAYDERDNTGELRYVQFTACARGLDERGAEVVAGVDGGPHFLPTSPSDDLLAAVHVALVWNAPPSSEEIPTRLRLLADDLLAGVGDPTLVRGVCVNLNDAADNVIVGDAPDAWRELGGANSLYSSWCAHGDARVCYHPGSFMQANVGAYNRLLESLRAHVPADAAVGELYAGAGAIGLSIAAAGGKEWRGSLRATEAAEAARVSFELSAATLPKATRARVSFGVERAEHAAGEAVRDADVVIVNPPRKGLDAKTRATLTGRTATAAAAATATASGRETGGGGRETGGSEAKRRRRRRKRKKATEAADEARLAPPTPPPPPRLRTFIYVSCGFDSFVRDCDELCASGEWTLKHAEGHAFFPGSDAIETLAVFARVLQVE
jgi:tRNA/tmRNA/rRNA uracil-C5-methylase (TrmA/RlmC/RlmD family)